MFYDTFTTACRTHHLSAKTQRAYWHFAKHYLKWVDARSVQDLNLSPAVYFRKYLSEMANKGVSTSTQNSAFHAIKFLYEKVVGVKLGDLSDIPKAKVRRRIVDVPDEDVASKLVTEVPGSYGTALRLIYGTGGRLNDILKLRVKDLDFEKKLIAFQHSKGDKARLVPMPQSLVTEIEKLIWNRDGEQLLFPICDMTLQRAFAESKRKLGITRKHTIHTLRHATAHFWEKSGVPRSVIQELLGHSNSATTDVYLLSGQKSVANVPTPI